MMRRLLGCWLLLFAASFVLQAESPDSLQRDTNTFVQDFAGVIDAPHRQAIQALSAQIHEKTAATVLVVTVKSLDGLPIEDFVTQLQARWHVGRKGEDKGVILLLATADRHYRIEVGYGLEPILNDAKVGDIGRSMVPDLKQSDYGAAAELGVEEIGAPIAADAGVTLDAPAAPVHTYHRETVQNTHASHVGLNGLGLLLFLGFWAFLLYRRGIGRGGRGYWGGGGGGGGFWMGGGGFGGGGGGGGFGGGDSGGGGFGGGGGDSGGDSGGAGASGGW